MAPRLPAGTARFPAAIVRLADGSFGVIAQPPRNAFDTYVRETGQGIADQREEIDGVRAASAQRVHGRHHPLELRRLGRSRRQRRQRLAIPILVGRCLPRERPRVVVNCNAFQCRDSTEDASPRDQPRARHPENRAGAQHRKGTGVACACVVTRWPAPREEMDEQLVRRRLSAPPAHAEPACGHGQIDGDASGVLLVVGRAPQRTAQRIERFAMAQHADIEARLVLRRSQTAEVAAGPVDFLEDMRSVPPVVHFGQVGKTRQPEPPPPQPCLAQPSP